MQVTVLLLAAGSGRRFGSAIPKQYTTVEGHPLLFYGLRSLAKEPRISTVQPVTAADDSMFQRCVQGASFPFRILPPVPGGETRADSMSRGLRALSDDVEWVAVQDAARPMPSDQLLRQVLDDALEYGAAVPGVPVNDTIKEIDAHGRVIRTLQRDVLRAIQTPQVARRSWFVQAIDRLQDDLQAYTDDASLLEAAGFPVFVSRGEWSNRKITTPEDMAWLRQQIREGRA
ncbi:MAG TPA: 2-C-methyl-D-erythritol 4-phosphate cytidylyltransferase [Mariprofundaceae bacterium]|nr:2-C-methyl-D-erythritol 4-phosphate cytidylyltransferase [Mariprofundaceae bacterium]